MPTSHINPAALTFHMPFRSFALTTELAKLSDCPASESACRHSRTDLQIQSAFIIGQDAVLIEHGRPESCSRFCLCNPSRDPPMIRIVIHMHPVDLSSLCFQKNSHLKKLKIHESCCLLVGNAGLDPSSSPILPYIATGHIKLPPVLFRSFIPS